jgi:hypothetical protein
MLMRVGVALDEIDYSLMAGYVASLPCDRYSAEAPTFFRSYLETATCARPDIEHYDALVSRVATALGNVY